jgi:Co/Zn/Cd efflux system component
MPDWDQAAFVFGSDPEPAFMMSVALLPLVANVSCLLLIAKHRGGGAHMKAAWIRSNNDVLANLGVIVAGALVAWSGSPATRTLLSARSSRPSYCRVRSEFCV